MSKIENIWTEVYNILKTAILPTYSLSYVKEVLQGVSESLPIFPVIVLEPLNEREENYTVPNMKRVYFQFTITCWMEVYKKEDQIIGSSTDSSKGILDMVTDVKNELSKFQNLNAKCQKIHFPTTNFSFENYPFRSGEIIMEVEYIAESTNR